MKTIILFILSLLIYKINSISFNDSILNLEILELYIKEYKSIFNPNDSLTHLIVSYIREGKYTGNAWSMAGGNVPSDLVQYIKNRDLENNTNTEEIRKYPDIILPSNETLDFVHLFAVMNGIENGNSYSDNYAHLVGWGGDTAQLFQDIKNEKGNLDELINLTKNYFGKKGQFGEGDLIADLDAPILLKKKNDNNTFANIIFNYYNGKEYLNRINNFVKITFPLLKSKNQFRDEIFRIYSSDFSIKVLECNYGLRKEILTCYIPGNLLDQYNYHQKAAVYVFSDYLSEGFNYETEDEDKEENENENKNEIENEDKEENEENIENKIENENEDKEENEENIENKNEIENEDTGKDANEDKNENKNEIENENEDKDENKDKNGNKNEIEVTIETQKSQSYFFKSKITLSFLIFLL